MHITTKHRIATSAHIRATGIGPLAAQAIDRGGIGVVEAVFPRALYLKLGGAIVCLTASDVSAGPISICCNLAPSPGWCDHTIRQGQRAQVSGRTIRFAEGTRIVIDAPVWSPPPPVPLLKSGADAASELTSWAIGRAQDQGIFQGVFGGECAADLLSRRAIAMAREVEHWISSSSLHAPKAVGGLIGLGHGLTPSGDDFLCGVLVTLSQLGRTEKASAVWQEIQPSLARTNVISAAFLQAAGTGMASADFHQMVVRLALQEDFTVHASEVVSYGATSGWDAMAGCVTVLRGIARSVGRDIERELKQ